MSTRAEDARGPVVDFVALDRLAADVGGAHFVSELIDDFVSAWPQRMAELRAAETAPPVLERDVPAGVQDITRVAHTVASAAALLGAARLAELARRVEARARAACEVAELREDPCGDVGSLQSEVAVVTASWDVWMASRL